MKKEFMPKLALTSLLIPIVVLTGALVIARTQQRSEFGKVPSSDGVLANPEPKAVAEKWHLESLPATVAENEARALLEKGQYAAAEAACRRALKGRAYMISALQLLGEIYMAQGRNREALAYFGQCFRYTRSTELDMNVALAHYRLGELDKARRQFDVEKWLLKYGRFSPEELPGTRTAKMLEASLLFAHGLNEDMSSNENRAVQHYAAAARIVPTNGLIAYFQAMALKELKRTSEALSCFTRAVAYGNSKIVRESTYQLSLWPDAERQKALKEAARLKAAKS